MAKMKKIKVTSINRKNMLKEIPYLQEMKGNSRWKDEASLKAAAGVTLGGNTISNVGNFSSGAGNSLQQKGEAKNQFMRVPALIAISVHSTAKELSNVIKAKKDVENEEPQGECLKSLTKAIRQIYVASEKTGDKITHVNEDKWIYTADGLKKQKTGLTVFNAVIDSLKTLEVYDENDRTNANKWSRENKKGKAKNSAAGNYEILHGIYSLAAEAEAEAEAKAPGTRNPATDAFDTFKKEKALGVVGGGERELQDAFDKKRGRTVNKIEDSLSAGGKNFLEVKIGKVKNTSAANAPPVFEIDGVTEPLYKNYFHKDGTVQDDEAIDTAIGNAKIAEDRKVAVRYQGYEKDLNSKDQKLRLIKMIMAENNNYPKNKDEFKEFIQAAGGTDYDFDKLKMKVKDVTVNTKYEERSLIPLLINLILNRHAVWKADPSKGASKEGDLEERAKLIGANVTEVLMGGAVPQLDEDMFRKAAESLLMENEIKIVFDSALLKKAYNITSRFIDDGFAANLGKEKTARGKSKAAASTEERFLAMVTEKGNGGTSKLEEIRKVGGVVPPLNTLEGCLYAVLKPDIALTKENIITEFIGRNTIGSITGNNVLLKKQKSLLIFALSKRELIGKKEGSAFSDIMEYLAEKANAPEEEAEEPDREDMRKAIRNLLVSGGKEDINGATNMNEAAIIDKKFLKTTLHLISRPELLALDEEQQIAARKKQLAKVGKEAEATRLTGEKDTVGVAKDKVSYFANNILEKLKEVKNLDEFKKFISSLYYLEKGKSIDTNVTVAVTGFESALFQNANDEDWKALVIALLNRSTLDRNTGMSQRRQRKQAVHADEEGYQELLSDLTNAVIVKELAEGDFIRAAKNLIFRQIDEKAMGKYVRRRKISKNNMIHASKILATSDTTHIVDWLQVSRAVFARNEAVNTNEKLRRKAAKSTLLGTIFKIGKEPPTEDNLKVAMLADGENRFKKSKLTNWQMKQISGVKADAAGKSIANRHVVKRMKKAEQDEKDVFGGEMVQFSEDDFKKLLTRADKLSKLKRKRGYRKDYNEIKGEGKNVFISLLQSDTLKYRENYGVVRKKEQQAYTSVTESMMNYALGADNQAPIAAQAAVLPGKANKVLRNFDKIHFLCSQRDRVKNALVGVEERIKDTEKAVEDLKTEITTLTQGNAGKSNLPLLEKEKAQKLRQVEAEKRKISKLEAIITTLENQYKVAKDGLVLSNEDWATISDVKRDNKNFSNPITKLPDELKEVDVNTFKLNVNDVQEWRETTANYLAKEQIKQINNKNNLYLNAALTLFSPDTDEKKLTKFRSGNLFRKDSDYNGTLGKKDGGMNRALFYRALNQATFAQKMRDEKGDDKEIGATGTTFYGLEADDAEKLEPAAINNLKANPKDKLEGYGGANNNFEAFNKLTWGNVRNLSTYAAQRTVNGGGVETAEDTNLRAKKILVNFLNQLLAVDFSGKSQNSVAVRQCRIVSVELKALPDTAIPLVYNLLANRTAVDLNKGTSVDKNGSSSFRHEMNQNKMGELVNAYLNSRENPQAALTIDKEISKRAFQNLFTRDMNEKKMNKILGKNAAQDGNTKKLLDKEAKKDRLVDWRLLRRVLSITKNRALYTEQFTKQHRSYLKMMQSGHAVNDVEDHMLENRLTDVKGVLMANVESKTRGRPGRAKYDKVGATPFSLSEPYSSILDEDEMDQFNYGLDALQNLVLVDDSSLRIDVSGSVQAIKTISDIKKNWTDYSKHKLAGEIVSVFFTIDAKVAETVLNAPGMFKTDANHQGMADQSTGVLDAVMSMGANISTLAGSIAELKKQRGEGASPRVGDAILGMRVANSAVGIAGGAAAMAATSLRVMDINRGGGSEAAASSDKAAGAIPIMQIISAGLGLATGISRAIEQKIQGGGTPYVISSLNAAKDGLRLAGSIGTVASKGWAKSTGYGTPVAAMVGNILEIAKLSAQMNETKKERKEVNALKARLSSGNDVAESVLTDLDQFKDQAQPANNATFEGMVKSITGINCKNNVIRTYLTEKSKVKGAIINIDNLNLTNDSEKIFKAVEQLTGDLNSNWQAENNELNKRLILKTLMRGASTDAMKKRLRGGAGITSNILGGRMIEQGWQITGEILSSVANLAGSIPGAPPVIATVLGVVNKVGSTGGTAITKKVANHIRKNASIDDDTNLTREYEILRKRYSTLNLEEYANKKKKRKLVLSSLGLRDENSYYHMMISRAASELYMQAQYANAKEKTTKNALTLGTLQLLSSLQIADINKMQVTDLVRVLAQ